MRWPNPSRQRWLHSRYPLSFALPSLWFWVGLGYRPVDLINHTPPDDLQILWAHPQTGRCRARAARHLPACHNPSCGALRHHLTKLQRAAYIRPSQATIVQSHIAYRVPDIPGINRYDTPPERY